MLNLKLFRIAQKLFAACKVSEPTSSLIYILNSYSPIQFGSKQPTIKHIPPQHYYYLQNKIRKRMNHVPIQYLTDWWHFRYLKLKLKRSVFIPRLETEWMITILKERLEGKGEKERVFVDFCCGSGVIGLSIAKELGYQGVMVDLNPKSVQVTNKNKQINKIQNVQVLNQRFQDYLQNCDKQFDIVMSNPPYIKDSDVNTLQKQVRRYQSHLALKGGKDGLRYVYYLLDNYQKIIKQDGILMIQYGGEPLEGDYQKYQKYVVNDQYEKRRFIVIQNTN